MDFTTLIESATSETNTSDNWPVIIQICELADRNASAARECVNVLAKRITHRNINVVLFSLTIANSLLTNCGMPTKRELISRPFLDPLTKLVTKESTHQTLKNRILDLIKTWASDCKSDSSLDYIQETFTQLKNQGFEFPTTENEKPVDYKPQNKEKDREEEELQLALALSLSSTKDEQKAASPPAQQASSVPYKRPSPPHLFTVRALYDFPAYDEGELRLRRGDMVKVYDDSTFKDWWKGDCNGSVGIFPNNYVEKVSDGGASQQYGSDPEARLLSNAHKVDKFVQMLSTVDMNRSINENSELQDIYAEVLAMRPEINKQIETYRVKTETFKSCNERFGKASESYHRLMDTAMKIRAQQQPQYQQPYQQTYQQPVYQPQPQQPAYTYESQQPASYNYDYNAPQQPQQYIPQHPHQAYYDPAQQQPQQQF